jgi:uncharacterized short protein YbdD (DUF466 family)
MRPIPTEAHARAKKHRALALATWMKRLAVNLWLGIREWCGDSAYERYVQAQKTNPEKSALLSPAQFYVERVDRRYSRPNRCC